MNHHQPPAWALKILCDRLGQDISIRNDLIENQNHEPVGGWEGQIADFGLMRKNQAIDWYESLGGTKFQERMEIPFTMSSLDAPVYRSCLEALRPASLDSLIVDVGGGDGRNTIPWLEMGYRRIVCVDPIKASLLRLRDYLEQHHPGWDERVLLVVADARRLPLRDGSADLVMAVEVLCYLNEEFSAGVSECARLLGKSGRFLWVDRAWEGALFVRLLYEGLPGMLAMMHSTTMLDGPREQRVASRVFTENEMTGALKNVGLQAKYLGGASILPVLMGAMRTRAWGESFGLDLLDQTRALMGSLWKDGHAKRTLAFCGTKVD